MDYMKNYLSTSLDDLDFDEALEKDKRNIYQIFIDLAKDKHMIIRTFFVSDNVRPRSIKILLFILILALYFVINALMYNDEYISEIYHSNEKEEDFLFFLKNSMSRLLYASVIGIVITFFIEFYFIDDKKLKRIFLRNRKNKEIKNKICNLIKITEKKYKSFIFISYLMTSTSWYYIFCFNNVYPNTSMNWIKSSLFIIIIIQLLFFVYIFIESILRKISFKCESEGTFKISTFLIK